MSSGEYSKPILPNLVNLFLVFLVNSFSSQLILAPVAISAVPVKIPKTDPINDPGEGGEQISGCECGSHRVYSDPAESKQLHGD